MTPIRIILTIAIVACAVFLLWNPLPFTSGLVLILGLLTILWGVSLLIKDSSIIDIAWGPGFVVLAWFNYLTSPGPGAARNVILCCMVTIWGVRLAWHIGRRNLGKGEDFRYKTWRQEAGRNYWWISFFKVFMLQGVLLWIIGSVFLVAMSDSSIRGTWLDLIGIGLWIIGFLFEAIGDRQLRRFKQDPQNKGKVLNTGLWRYTRHPNYFGDALLWWGYFMFVLGISGGWMYVFSPLIMTFLLMKVSGVAMLEETLVETKPKYREYVEKTAAFFPWFPKK